MFAAFVSIKKALLSQFELSLLSMSCQPELVEGELRNEITPASTIPIAIGTDNF